MCEHAGTYKQNPLAVHAAFSKRSMPLPALGPIGRRRKKKKGPCRTLRGSVPAISRLRGRLRAKAAAVSASAGFMESEPCAVEIGANNKETKHISRRPLRFYR